MGSSTCVTACGSSARRRRYASGANAAPAAPAPHWNTHSACWGVAGGGLCASTPAATDVAATPAATSVRGEAASRAAPSRHMARDRGGSRGGGGATASGGPPLPLPSAVRDAPATPAAVTDAEPAPVDDAAPPPGGKISSCPASTAAGWRPGAVAIAARGGGDRRSERPMLSRRADDDGGVTIVTRAIEREPQHKGGRRRGRAQ